MEVNGRRFLSGEPPLLFENPLDDLSSHLAVQYDYYIEAKRVFLAALSEAAMSKHPGAKVMLPAGMPTLSVAREVLLCARVLTDRLKGMVPRRATL